MVQTQKTDAFEFYNKAIKSWMDNFPMWSKMPAGFGPVMGGGVESPMKPFWGYLDDWNKVYAGFTDMMKGVPVALEPTKNMSDAISKGINAYVKIYDAWLRGMDNLAREGFEIGQRISAGEEVDTSKFLKAMEDTYETISSSVIQSLHDTPMAGIKELDEAVKKSMESLSGEQTMAREFVNEIFGLNVQLMNLGAQAFKEAAKSSSEMLEKGTIPSDGYSGMISSYGDLLKHSVEVLRFPAAIVPGYQEIADNATNWAKANLDLSVAWANANLKLYHGISRSATEIQEAAQELVKDKKISTPDQFYTTWSEVYEKVSDILANRSQFYESMPKLVNAYTDYIKAGSKLYQSAMNPPCATKEDLARLHEELAKIKATVEKKASVRARAEE